MRHLFLLPLLALAAAPALAQPRNQTAIVRAEMVYNFAPNRLRQIFPAGNRLLVMAGNSSQQTDLWTCSGAPGNATRLHADFADYARLDGYESWQGLAQLGTSYFLNPPHPYPAGSTSYDQEVWLTDGTVAGTRQMGDLNPNAATYPNSADPNSFVSFNGQVLFNAQQAPAGTGLFRTTGTLAGTQLINGLYYIAGGTVNFQDTVLYTKASGPSPNWPGLYRIRRNFQSSLIAEFDNIFHLQRLGNRMIFWGNKPSMSNTAGYEPYVSDGTAAGTRLLRDIVPGPLSPTIVDGDGNTRTTTRGIDRSFQVWNGRAYFACQIPQPGSALLFHLYVTDGTPAGTTLVFSSPSYISWLHATTNGVIFNAQDPVNPAHDIVFRTDGTAAGTGPIVSSRGETFCKNDGVSNAHCSDAAGTHYASGYMYPTRAGNRSPVLSLFVSDGSVAGTKLVAVATPSSLPTFPSYVPDFNECTVLNGYFYFEFDDKLHRFRLADITLGTRLAAATAPPLTLWPNPAGAGAGSVHLRLPAPPERSTEVRVFDVRGALVLHQTLALDAGSEGVLALEGLAPGLYRVDALTATGHYAARLVR